MDSKRLRFLLSKYQIILHLREFCHSEKYRVFTQHAAVAIMRHSATMGLTPRNPALKQKTVAFTLHKCFVVSQ